MSPCDSHTTNSAHLQNYRIIILDFSHLVMYNFGSGLLAIKGRIGRIEEEKLQKG